MTFIEYLPDPIELLSFFESAPFLSNKADHHYGYKYSDDNGLTLIFSYSALEGWIQTVIEFNGETISQHLSEGVKGFNVGNEKQGDVLSADIDLNEIRTQIEVRLKPHISIKWNTLIK